jgi:hypothetical protein
MNATTLKYRQLRRGSSGTPKVYDWMFGAVAKLEKVASLNALALRTSLDEQRVLLRRRSIRARFEKRLLFNRTNCTPR